MSTISVDYDVLNQRGSPAWFTDTFANIPTAGYVGRMFISKDTFAFYRDTGTGWDLIGGPGIGTLTGSGVVGQVSFFNGTQVLAGNNNLFWDNTNSRLGINTTTPGQPLDIHSTGNTLVQLNNTTTANSNISFQNQNVAKWRVGNVYNAGANSFDIQNAGLLTNAISINSTTNNVNFGSTIGNGTYTYTFPSATGTFALTSDLTGYVTLATAQTITGAKQFTSASKTEFTAGISISNTASGGAASGNTTIGANVNGLQVNFPTGGYNNLNFASTTVGNTYTYPNATGTLALTSDLSSYLPLAGGTLTGGLYINPTNTGITGLDVASNKTIFRSDNLEGFKRQLEITMGSGILVQLVAKGFGGNYITDLAFYTSTSGGTNASPGIYITGTNNRVGIKTGLPAYDLDVSGTAGVSGELSVTSGLISISGSGGNPPTSGVGLRFVSNRLLIYGGSTDITFQKNSNASANMIILESGNVLIGTSTDAGRKLNVFADNAQFGDTGSFTFYMNVNSGAATGVSWDIAGSVRLNILPNGVTKITNLAGTGSRAVLADANGTLSAPVSDKLVKENIIPIGYGLNEIIKMNPVWFNFIDEYKNFGNGRQNGNIAQEMELIIPEAVFLTPSTNKMGINYEQLHAVYIKAIQELNEKLVRNNIN